MIRNQLSAFLNKIILCFIVYQFNTSYAVNIENVDMEQLYGKKVCFYPGSFDPIHRGHEGLIKKCINEEGYDYVLVSVAGESDYHKPNRTSPVHRREMVDLLFRENFKVLTFLGTAKELQEYIKPHIDKINFVGLVGSDTLYSCFMRVGCDHHFMMGEPIPEDNADLGFASGRLLYVKEFVVNMRVGDNLDLSDGSYLYDGRKVLRIIHEENAISSTFIRKAYEENNANVLKQCLDEKIIKYIEENNIFSKSP